MLSLLRHYSLPDILRIIIESCILILRQIWFVPFNSIAWRKARAQSLPRQKDSILFFSQVVWQDVWQRPQEMSLRLSRHRPLIYISPMQIHRRYDSVRDWTPHVAIPEAPDCHVFQPLILPGEYQSKLIRRINRGIIRRCLRELILRHGLPRHIITNSPFYDFIADDTPEARLTYDVIDDFILAGWAPREGESCERRIISRAGQLWTGTLQLLETKQALHPRVEFIPLGVNYDAFQFETPPPEPEELNGIPRPRLGYIGTLNERLDAELIEQLARACPEASVVLIGPLHGTFAPRPSAPNVHLLGPCRHDCVPQLLAHFDIALIPFKVNAMTRSLNPIKTLEYLAAGRVVIAVDLPDLRRLYGNVALIAESPERFIQLAREQLAADRSALEARGRDAAQSHTWDAMADRMHAALLEIENA